MENKWYKSSDIIWRVLVREGNSVVVYAKNTLSDENEPDYASGKVTSCSSEGITLKSFGKICFEFKFSDIEKVMVL